MNIRLLPVLFLGLGGCGSSQSLLVFYLSNLGVLTDSGYEDLCTENFVNAECPQVVVDDQEPIEWTSEYEAAGTPGQAAYSFHFGPKGKEGGEGLLAKGEAGFAAWYWYEGKDLHIVARRDVELSEEQTQTHTSGYTYTDSSLSQQHIMYNLTVSSDGLVFGTRDSTGYSEERQTESDSFNVEQIFYPFGSFCNSLAYNDEDPDTCNNRGDRTDCTGDCELVVSEDSFQTYDVSGIWFNDSTSSEDLTHVGQPENGADW